MLFFLVYAIPSCWKKRYYKLKNTHLAYWEITGNIWSLHSFYTQKGLAEEAKGQQHLLLWAGSSCKYSRDRSIQASHALKLCYWIYFSSVQFLNRVQLFATPWIAARRASLSITNSWSSLKLTSIESVMPSSHPILCHPPFLLPPIPPSISKIHYFTIIIY